jgi:hypothetical protein
LSAANAALFSDTVRSFDVLVANAIKSSGIAFDQLIYEGAWVHIGLSDGNPRQQVLTAIFDKGRASYVMGIT